jgi:hypothetical protein
MLRYKGRLKTRMRHQLQWMTAVEVKRSRAPENPQENMLSSKASSDVQPPTSPRQLHFSCGRRQGYRVSRKLVNVHTNGTRCIHQQPCVPFSALAQALLSPHRSCGVLQAGKRWVVRLRLLDRVGLARRIGCTAANA